MRTVRKLRREAVARGRGWLRHCLGSLFGNRVAVGKSVRINGRVMFRGPGRVLVGDGSNLNGEGSVVTPFTYGPDAILSIGKHCFINGTRFGCANRIRIGDYCVLADVRITDCDFHPLDAAARRRGEPGKVGSVEIGDDVWIGAGAIVLRDTVIGRGSVVGAGAVVKGTFPADSLIAGNPARVVRSLVAEAATTN